jgi:hypothetical protein
MLKYMGLIRVVAALALVAACDKGKVEPTKGSAEPAPPPVPDPAPVPVDAMSIDEQLLHGIEPALPDAVWVRACNDTGKQMESLEWHEDFKAPGLAKGECTRYHPASHAYGYTYAKFTLGKDEFIIQPIDYMGETPLSRLHSYHIKIIDYAHRSADIRAKLDSTTKKLEVRTCNDTNHDFKEAQVFQVPVVPNGGALKRHECTPYFETKQALSITAASFKVGDDRFMIQPHDYVGARALNPGRWSYRLVITDGRDHDARVDVKQDPW